MQRFKDRRWIWSIAPSIRRTSAPSSSTTTGSTRTGDSLDKLTETLATLREIERQNQERIDAMGERIAALESVPASRWQKATDYVLAAVLGLAVGAMAASIGLG